MTDQFSDVFFKGGLKLKIPFINLVTSGCWPTLKPSIGNNVAERADLEQFIVRYIKPFSNNLPKKFITSVTAGAIEQTPCSEQNSHHCRHEEPYVVSVLCFHDAPTKVWTVGDKNSFSGLLSQ